MGDGETRMQLTLVYPEAPVSFNAVGARGGQRSFHRLKKKWQEVFEVCMMQTGFPRGHQRAVASAELRFRTRHRRDTVNYRTLLEKALGDALVNGGWIPDDTPEHFIFERVLFAPEPGEPETKISLAFT